MKKVILPSLIFLSSILCANELMYTSSVKNLYENIDNNTAKGRLLPTSEITVLEKKDGKIKIQVQGYMKEDVSNAIYFNQKNRILIAGLTKENNFEIKTISTNKDEEGNVWKKVELTAFTNDDNLTKDINSLYTEAEKIYKDSCSMCHQAHPIDEYTANQWPSIIKSMLSRTAMTKEQNYLVVQYLQKHAKDIQGEEK